MNSIIILQYLLWFLIVLALITATHMIFVNPEKINVNFFGSSKNIHKGIFMGLVFLDGIMVGLALCYLLS